MNEDENTQHPKDADIEKLKRTNVGSDSELTLVQGWLLVFWAWGLLLFTWLCFSGTISFGAEIAPK